MDVCPDMPKSSRSKEVRRWLSRHPNATRYAIIDDEDDDLDDLPLFQPSSNTGLTREIANGVKKYLSGETDKTMRATPILRLGQNIHALFKRDRS
jgi:hypothetical protein